MARLRVPAAAQGGLALLTKLSKEQMSSLKEALRRASPGLVLPELVERIASAVPFSDDDASKVIAILASFYSLKLEKGLSFDKFFDELFGALKCTENKDLKLSDEQASQFRKHLEELLSLDESPVRSSLFLSVSEFLEELTEKTGPIQPLVDLIQEACRKLLELPEDWDEEGSPGYSKDTCERATRFLLNHARWFWNRHGIIVDAPRIVAGPHGSIDIYWKDENAELLLNVPADPRKSITCYGDSKSGFKVGGPLKDSDYRRALWSWLKGDNKQLDESSR